MLNFSIVFPGQGSQSLGMLSALSASYPVIEKTFKTASEIVGFDCWSIAQSGPEATLNQTAYTQPILLAADIALWRIYCDQCAWQPTFLAGHSLGEYAALVAAQALSFEDAVYLVAQRGEFMQSAGGGSMAAILGLDNSVIEECCQEIMDNNISDNNTVLQYIVAPANYNTIGQTVIAGHRLAVEEAIDLLKARGAKRAILLPVSVPSHCALMQPAAEQLAELLEKIEIKVPQIPIIHNSDLKMHIDAKSIKRILCEQLVQPVRWLETINYFSEHHIKNIIECGPGKVLSGLIKRIDSDIHLYNMDTPTSLSEILCLKTA